MSPRGAVTSQNFTARTRALLTQVNLHYVGIVLLALVNLVVVVELISAWRGANGRDAAAVAHQTSALHSAELASRPLQGLDAKLEDATTDADSFYRTRLPFAGSQVASELGLLANRYQLKLSRVGYSEVPVLEGTPGALTELRMDASLSGEYRPLVLFVNSLERDKMFFVITGLTFTGQQSGTVGLRLRLETLLRPPGPLEAPIPSKVLPDASAAVPESAAGGTP